MPDIFKESSPTAGLYNGHTVVGTSAVALCPKLASNRGVLIRAGDTNTAPIWVGRASVTADSAATGGMPIPPATALFIPCDDPSLVFVISTAGGQDVAWMGV